MKKRLRFAMPYVPLKQREEPSADDRVHNMESALELKPVKTHVGTMAKRIAQKESKKRRSYKQPEPRPLGGDLTSSDSDDSPPDGAWGGDVDNETEI